ncbi:hypothetical protein, partial [Candidatus Nitrosarchaeum limnium]
MSISDMLSVTLSKFLGDTTSDTSNSLSADSSMSISDSLTVILTRGFSIDDAKLALKFDSLVNGTASGNAKISENSLKLDGDLDFIDIKDNSTNNFQTLTVSA